MVIVARGKKTEFADKVIRRINETVPKVTSSRKTKEREIYKRAVLNK